MNWILIFLSSSRHCLTLQFNSNKDKRDNCEKYSFHPWNDVNLCYLDSSLVKLSTWKLAAWVLHHIRFFLSWKKRCNWPFCGGKNYLHHFQVKPTNFSILFPKYRTANLLRQPCCIRNVFTSLPKCIAASLHKIFVDWFSFWGKHLSNLSFFLISSTFSYLI